MLPACLPAYTRHFLHFLHPLVFFCYVQGLRVQCSVFSRGAAALAGEGDEEDLAVVGTVLAVGEACERVGEVSVPSWGPL